MCSPMALTIASVGFQAFGQISQAAQQSAAAKSAAQVASANASIKEKAAQDAIQRGADNAGEARQKARESTAAFRAKAGSSGILADTGSNLDLQEQNAGVGEENALLIQQNAEREAYGYKVGAMNDTATAGAYKAKASNAMTNGLLSAGGTLVTGAANNGAFNSSSTLPWQTKGSIKPAWMGGGTY